MSPAGPDTEDRRPALADVAVACAARETAAVLLNTLSTLVMVRLFPPEEEQT